MSKETSKAMLRRMREADALILPWREIFTGRMLDVGCGDDKLPYDSCVGFDQPDGDANHLSRYFPAESFNVLHGSHVLEHMHDPTAALRDWLTIVKPGGYVVQTVPDWCAYERMQWPSRYNPDHKSSWSLIYKGSIAPIHCHLPAFLAQFKDVSDILLMRYVEENYDWKASPDIDQTWEPSQGVEIWNEFVLQKR